MSDWIELDLLPPWKPVEHFPPPAYRIDELGRCWMRGSAEGGAAGDPLAPLPEEARPSDDKPLVSASGEFKVIDGKIVPTIIFYEWGGGREMPFDYPT